MENKLDTSKDNTTEEIKQVVETEFNNNETFSGDDDEEIYTAGLAICKKYTEDLKGENSRALEPFEKLKAELKAKIKEIQGLGWFDSLTLDQKQEIHEVAQKIDNAENEVLKRLRLTRAKQSSAEIVQKAQESQGDKAVFEMEKDEKGNDTGVLVFTKAADPITIHQALKNLRLDPKQKYIIDYSQCDMTGLSQRVKEKMTSLIGIGTCYIFHDDSKKTFVVRDKDGNPVEDRVLICNKARLIPDGIKQFEAQQKIQTQNENLGTFDIDKNSDQSPEKDPQFKDMIAQIPSGLRSKLQSLDNKEYRKFIIATENRLATLLRDAKSQSYELSTEPITKTRFTSGLMELHLVAGDNEKNITIWNSDNHGELGDNLYDILDDNDFESDYKSYLTDRVEAKRAEFEGLTKNQLLNLNTKEGETGIDDTARSNILNGLKLWNTTIENYKNGEGDSWLDNDDKKLVAMMQLIRDAQYTLEKNNPTSLEAITNTIITPLRDKWVDFNYETPLWTKNHQQTFQKIFLGKPEEQINAIRETCKRVTIIDNTETSHLANEIAMENIELNDTTLNDYFQNIKNKLEIKEDDPEAAEKKDLIDDLYDKAKNDKDGTDILGFLTSDEVKLLPKSWATDPDVKKKALEIGRTLRKNQEKMDALTENAIMERQEKLRLELEAKVDKTEEDIVMLQGLTFLSQNPGIAQEEYAKIMEKEKDGIKYGGINELFIKTFITTFVDKADGVKGTNADILNDIVGVGRFDLSDENAKFAGELLVDIAITIAVSLLTAGTGAVVMGGILRVGSGIAKGLKATKLLQKIEKTIQTLSKLKSTKTLKQTFNVYKNATRGEKATLLGITASEKALEAPIFNAALATFNAAIHGTSLDSLNLNPLAKENLKTAAFLGALSLGNKLGMGMIGKLHGAHKLVAFSKAGLNDVLKNYKGMWTESLISEATAMFGAEQGMNFVFGTDVINPVTGEVETTRSLQRPTEGERVQMIGMILAFKAFKPQLWAKYEKKINDGTLQVCRSTNKNEVLLRDPKTGKIGNIQDLIDNKDNNNITQEAREVKQRKNISYFDYAGGMIRLRKAKNLPDALKRFADANNDYKKLTIDDIKNLQREIGLTGDAVDGIVGSTTVEQLKRYLNSENFGKLHTQAVQQEAEMNRKKAELDEIKSRINEYDADYEQALKPRQEALKAKEKDLQTKKEDLRRLQEKRQKICEQGGNIDYYQSGIESHIQRLEGEITTLRETIKTIEQELKQFSDESLGLSGDIDNLRGEVVTKQGKVDELQKKLSQQEEELQKLQKPQNIVNRETLAEDLALQRVSTNNANNGPMTFNVNENYTGEIIQGNDNKSGYILLKPKNGGENIRINRDPSAEYWRIINDTGGKNVDGGQSRKDRLKRADAEIAEKIALELPDGAIEFVETKRDIGGERSEAEKCKNAYSDQNLEICERKNGHIIVRKVSNEEVILQQEISATKQELSEKKQDLLYTNAQLTEKQQAYDEASTQITAKIQKLEQANEKLGQNIREKENLHERLVLDQAIKAKKQEIEKLTQEIKTEQSEQRQAEIVHTPAKQELQAQKRQAEADLATAKQQLETTQKAIDNLEIGSPEGPAERASAKAEAEAAKKKTPEDTNTPRTVERKRNTEKKEFSEVERDTDVIAIGDLHGEYAALKGNMEYAGLAREVNGHLEWKGGNKKVVFQGDILADRGTEGLKIIQEIHQLREQARKQGGDIDIVVGNHDDFMISFLTQRNGIHGDGTDISFHRNQGVGLTELLDFIGIRREGFVEIDDGVVRSKDIRKLKGRDVEILEAMRNSTEGKIILEEICNMKLVSQVDDVLYLHTNPTQKILRYLTEGTGTIQEKIDVINQTYQSYLRQKLLGESTGRTISTEDFNKISDIFLDTENRYVDGIDGYMETLRNNGINMISHGHSGGSEEYGGYTGHEKTVGGVRIVDTDYSYGKFGEYSGEHSLSLITKEGIHVKGDTVEAEILKSIKDSTGSRIVTEENRAELDRKLADAERKTEKEREELVDETLEQTESDIIDAAKESARKGNLSEEKKKKLKKDAENMDKAAKLTKDTNKLTLFQRFKSRIFELLNRNRYGEFMKSLRSKEGLTIHEAKYKIIEKEGKKFIQMTDKNGKEIGNSMEMNYKKLDELHKEYLQDKKANELHQKNMSDLETIKQKTAKELAEAKQTYIKAAENLKKRFPDYKQFEGFKKILESKTTLEDANKVRDSFSKALINTLKPGDTVTLSRTIMGTTDYIVAKDSKGNLTFTHAKEKLSVEDMQDIMKKEDIEIKRKAEISDSESVKDKKGETLSETGDDIISNAGKEQQAINWDKSDYGFDSYKISEVDQILNEKGIPHFNTLNKEGTGYMAFETSNGLELIIYENGQATYRIVGGSTYDITGKHIPSTSLKQVLEGHQLQFISASEDGRTPNFIDVSKSPYKEHFENIKKDLSKASLRISGEYPETSEVSLTKEELQEQKFELEQQLESLENLGEQNRSQLLNLKTKFLESFLTRGNIITINQLKYKYNGFRNNKAVFTIDSKSKNSSNLGNKFPQETITVSSLTEFLDPRFNLEPGNKNNNSGRNEKLRLLIDQQKSEEARLIQLGKNYTDEYFKIQTQLNNINQQLQNFETVKFKQGIIERAA